MEDARVCQGRMPECTVALQSFSLKLSSGAKFWKILASVVFKVMVHCLSNGDEEDMMRGDKTRGHAHGTFPLELSPHTSRLMLPFSLKSLCIPRR